MADDMNVDGVGGPGGSSAVVPDPGPVTVAQTPAQMRMHRRQALMSARNETSTVRANVKHKAPKKGKKRRSKRARPHK